MKTISLVLVVFLFSTAHVFSQDTAVVTHIMPDSTALGTDTPILHTNKPEFIDSTFRIVNISPYFSLHVDSVFTYDLHINRPAENYYWYLRSGPLGMRMDKNTGLIWLKVDKSLFKNGKLKYDKEYKVQFGVQNLKNPQERVDTSFTLVFYSTDINPSNVRPSVTSNLFYEEGDSIRFKVQCEQGNFSIEQITMATNLPINNYTAVNKCDDVFQWTVPYDFIRDGDTTKQKQLILQFIGTDKFFNKDTSTVRIFVRQGIDYPHRMGVHKKVTAEVRKYILSLKLSFYAISKSVKTNKATRTTFDISGSATALTGTILATSGGSPSTQNVGKILPGVGLTLVPVKEAVAPNKVQEQNTATQIRTVAKRLEYQLSENQLVGDRDAEILEKIRKIQDELRQARNQLIELPLVEFDDSFTPADAERYFNDPKVNRKYRIHVR